MSVAPITNNTSNRIETQKLYMTLLQFSLYDNPNKYYSRKIKLKKVPPLQSSHSGSGSSGPIEYVIASMYPTNTQVSTSQPDSIKTRKKMKLTSSASGASAATDKEQEGEPESPKTNKNISSPL